MAEMQLDRCFRGLFDYSVNKQQSDYADLIGIASDEFTAKKADGSKVYLPTEVWCIIFDISHCVTTCQTHLVFKKARIFNMDTYLMFSGTMREFIQAMTVLEFDHSDAVDNDDLPTEHFCSGACHDRDCPMERGAICSSLWQTFEFDTAKEMKAFETRIPQAYSYHGHVKVTDLTDMSFYELTSTGDSSQSISGKPLDKGEKKLCWLCGETFNLSDRHYFDDDQQIYYCSGECYEHNLA